MILLREDIAWVRAADGSQSPFDCNRLADSIHRAAATAGQADGLLAESVAAAVHTFARDCQPQHPMAAGEIAQMVVDILTMLAGPELASAYARLRSQTEIRLDEMTTGAMFELDFFRKLDAALCAAAVDAWPVVQVRGLRACVMRLRGAQRWTTGCRALADEIVGFVRDHSCRHVTRPLTVVE